MHCARSQNHNQSNLKHALLRPCAFSTDVQDAGQMSGAWVAAYVVEPGTLAAELACRQQPAEPSCDAHTTRCDRHQG